MAKPMRRIRLFDFNHFGDFRNLGFEILFDVVGQGQRSAGAFEALAVESNLHHPFISHFNQFHIAVVFLNGWTNQLDNVLDAVLYAV